MTRLFGRTTALGLLLTGGWYYTSQPSPAGISNDFFIAHMDATGAVTPENPTDATLNHVGLSRANVTPLPRHWRWPDGLS